MASETTYPGHGTRAAYGRVARGFHWLMAALLVWQFGVALTMVRLSEDWYHSLSFWHESTGVTLLALVTLRLVWRLIHPPPPLDVPPLMRLAAHANHAGLYVLLFAIPIVGTLMNDALNFPTTPFGLFTLPHLIAPDRERGFFLLAVHFWLGMALLALFAMHVSAALFHHFVLRDGTLRRMLPRRSADSA
jgi:cytochrome b561